ncbi:MAG: putative lipase/esterase [Chitinophagales bacterium]|nr:MAG: putative lipase/esterase [Chitinophagales bacterium]
MPILVILMNWKLRLVLLFARLRKPIEPNALQDVDALRRQAEGAARLGSFLFDKKLPIRFVADIPAGNVPVRIYRHWDAPDQQIIVYYHGGGFVFYGLDSHDYVCRRLCLMNRCLVVSVDYRLAPEHTFPAAHEDAFSALQWVREHIQNHGGNPDRIILMGDSAGGNLAACMAHKCKKERIPVLAQVLVYPWIDGKLENPSIVRNGKGYLLTREAMLWFQQQYTPRKEDQCHPLVSPCYEDDFSGLAPSFILTAELDPLRDDGYNYYQQLQVGGTHVVYREYPGLMHGFFNLPYVHPLALQAYHDIRDFLNSLQHP